MSTPGIRITGRLLRDAQVRYSAGAVNYVSTHLLISTAGAASVGHSIDAVDRGGHTYADHAAAASKAKRLRKGALVTLYCGQLVASGAVIEAREVSMVLPEPEPESEPEAAEAQA